ncbi:MAG: hypothetical protein KDB63_17560 [Nocardioidaceae bacterium]|nr:hypothetical protein [Nocardioidaceae bacterium]
MPTSPLLWGAAHKPGAIPLRPLTLGDVYDGAFKIIRFNARATVGPAVMLSAVSMMIPIIAVSIMTFALGMTSNPLVDDPYSADATTADILAVAGPYAALVVGYLLQSIGTLLITGMIAHVANAAAVGRRLTLGETWAATHGKRWRLLGLSVFLMVATLVAMTLYALVSVLIVSAGSGALTALWFLATVPALVVAALLVFVRVGYLAPTALMLEPVGVFGAFGRAWRLSRRQFWRLFGIALLTAVIVGFAAQLITFPIGIGVQVLGLAVEGGRLLLFFTVVGSGLAQVVASAFTIPFTASVQALQYLDQRMRKEAYDVELMTRAGITRA